MGIPRQLLRQLYTFGSLRNTGEGVQFELKNRLLEVTVTAVHSLSIDGQVVPLAGLQLSVHEGETRAAEPLGAPLVLPVRAKVTLRARRAPLERGHHELVLSVESREFGALSIEVEDVLGDGDEKPRAVRIPHRDQDDYTQDLVRARQRFVEEYTGVALEHITRFSFDPSSVRGNIENFTGVAQVPMGFAGPIHIDGEHARGEFLVPMATTEGTLVASYNRGIKVLNLAGGVKCTVSADAMQRAPVFIFDSAREARDFGQFIEENMADIRRVAEATSSTAKLLYIDRYLSNKFAFLRFNFSTGDAAGQNMVGRATFAACEWIVSHAKDIRGFYLEANLATDKKHSHVNIMHTRGKRVTAEATIARDLLVQHMRVTPEQLDYHAGLGTIGAILSGASNNGAHSPNGITAMFIATGQDVANVAESSAAILYTEVTQAGDLYLSLTIPSLIVATHGGGTGLPTQRECLRILGCTERGSVDKLAEIIAGVALAGELSLGAAISSLDWVSSHERMGRHR
jgi:hydroxymethylglutaryl-CoA reductase (NADPH)